MTAPAGAPASSKTGQTTRQGIALMVLASFLLAVQDGLSRHLAAEYGAVAVAMIRYWAFAALVVALAARRPGGVRAVAATRQLPLHLARGLILAAEVCVTVAAFVRLGLVETHAVFAAYPLMVAALSGPMLGERVGAGLWAAIAAGFAGILVILQPGAGVLRADALIPLGAAALFALYAVLTRRAARHDSAATCLFWTALAGAAGLSVAGIGAWQPVARGAWPAMAALCAVAATGSWALVACYARAEAAAVQPFAFLQLVFAAAIGVVVFGEALRAEVVAGAAIVIAAGLFAMLLGRPRRG